METGGSLPGGKNARSHTSSPIRFHGVHTDNCTLPRINTWHCRTLWGRSFNISSSHSGSVMRHQLQWQLVGVNQPLQSVRQVETITVDRVLKLGGLDAFEWIISKLAFQLYGLTVWTEFI
jgi:hypothetical protein